MGTSSNTGNEESVAVTYSVAKTHTQTNTNTDLATFKRPQFVTKLGEKFKWDNGSIESVEEVKKMAKQNNDDSYYDGTRNLGYYSQYCAKFSKVPNVCLQDKNCGWCYSSNTCIHGTSAGAVDACLPRHFVFGEENRLENNTVNTTTSNNNNTNNVSNMIVK